jgi:hypothetical protein
VRGPRLPYLRSHHWQHERVEDAQWLRNHPERALFTQNSGGSTQYTPPDFAQKEGIKSVAESIRSARCALALASLRRRRFLHNRVSYRSALSAAQRSGFSCRFAPQWYCILARFQTLKSPRSRREAVSWNPLLDGNRRLLFVYSVD